MLSRWSVGKLGKLGHVYSDVWRRSTGPEENLHKPGSSIWRSCLPRKSGLLTRLQHSTMSEWVIDRLTNHRKVHKFSWKCNFFVTCISNFFQLTVIGRPGDRGRLVPWPVAEEYNTGTGPARAPPQPTAAPPVLATPPVLRTATLKYA